MVVMTKGRSYQQQSYKVAAQFPCEWVRRKHNDGFMITCCGTIGSRDNYYWVVVVTAGTGYDSQAVELDFVYPSEAIHHYWDRGGVQHAFVLRGHVWQQAVMHHTGQMVQSSSHWHGLSCAAHVAASGCVRRKMGC